MSCPHCHAAAEVERAAGVRWRCAVCGGPVVPADGVTPRSGAEVAGLVGARRARTTAFGWTAAATALAVTGAMALGLAALLASASHASALVLGAVAGGALALAAFSSARARKRRAGARAQLDDAWEIVAAEVLRARGRETTAGELARTMRTDTQHAEALLGRLSARGRVRVEVRDDADLAYGYEADERAEGPRQHREGGSSR